MVRAAFSRLRERLRSWWDLDDPEERIEGSGEVHLDPAYNGRYAAERELQRLAAADEEDEAADSPPREP